MKTEIYELESKLKISKVEPCTPEEIEAIGRILSQKKALPVGIFRSKSGKYFKYADDTFTKEEKELFVKYKALEIQKKTLLSQYVIIILLTVITILALLNLII